LTRALLIACALFLACDQRVDELLAAGIQAVLEEPPRKPTNAPPSDCAEGSPQWAAPNVQRAIQCAPMTRDGGSSGWLTR
jgi:hypothetical protein